MIEDRILGGQMWVIMLIACGLAAIPFLAAGFRTSAGFLNLLLVMPATGAAAGRLLMRYRETYRLGALIEGCFFLSFAGFFGVMVTYAAAAGGAPLADANLLKLDQALGYDWTGYAQFTADHLQLLTAMSCAYESIFLQPLIILISLHLAHFEERWERFILACMISVLVTSIVFFFYPATTAWTFQNQGGLAAHILPALPLAENGWLADLARVRAGTERYLASAGGIIAFPSYHCVSALLNIWAIWPVRRLRPVFIVLNGLMIASAPIFGGHYASDLIGGAMVAFLTIWLVPPLHRSLTKAKFLHLPEPVERWLSCSISLRDNDCLRAKGAS